ncbi:hypothetical protein F350042L8_33550 [Fusobacterium ulcerans]
MEDLIMKIKQSNLTMLKTISWLEVGVDLSQDPRHNISSFL